MHSKKVVFWDWAGTLISPHVFYKFYKELAICAKKNDANYDIKHDTNSKINSCMFIPYAWAVVMELSKRNFKQVIATNASKEEIKKQAIAAPFRKFDLLLTATDFKPKPDIEMFVYALDKFEVDPKEAVFIGDSESDKQVARATRIDFLAVDGSYESYQNVAQEFGLF